MATSSKVLVVAPAWVGDMVLSQSLYKILCGWGAEVHVLAPAWSRDILARMPEVSASFETPTTHGEIRLGARYAMGRRLRRNQYDRAIVLPRSFKAALIPWFARIPVRTGYCGEMRYGVLNDVRYLGEDPPQRIVDRFAQLAPQRDEELLFAAPTPALTIDAKHAEALAKRFELELPSGQVVVALMPGAAFGPSKQWPIEHFIELAKRYVADGSHVWVLGSQADRALGDAMASQVATKAGVGVSNLCGRTSLVDTVDLLAIVDHAVSNDSGLMHIAAAVGCPIVAMYGATPVAYTPPMISMSKCLTHEIACRPCRSKTCRYGHYRCLTEITPETVYRAAQDLQSGKY